jgi:glycosyltransferase involved in cell wall biosynthesis
MLFTWLNARLEKRAFARTRHLVPVSEKVREELAELGFARNVNVILNGVDVREFTPAKKTGRSALGLPENVPLALFAGDIKSPRKNLDSVLKALAEIDGLHLAVAGSTEGSPYMRMAEELGLNGRVHFLGFRKDIDLLMSNVDFFVFPSRYEACTLAVIEALASGLPVVTTRQSGVSELVDGKLRAGIVLDDPEDVQGLQEAMAILARDASLRGQMGAAARAVAEEHSWDKVAAQYIQLFEKALAEKNAPSEPRILAFATQGAGGDDEARLKDLLSCVPAQFYPFDRNRKLQNFWRIIRRMRRDRPSLVVMEGTGIAGGAALIIGSWLTGIPYVVSSGDAVGPFVSSQHRWLGPFFTLYEKLLYKRSIGFIGWTPYLAGRALTYGAKFGMTAAGWAPFTLTEEELAAHRERIRRLYNIPESSIVIGIAGSLHWNRRVGYCYGYELVMALKRIKRQDVTVLIVGDGSGMAKLRQLGEGHPRLVLTGRVPRHQVPEYLAAMDLASLPQSVDQVGSFRYTTKISEYLAARLPVVTGKIPMSYDLNRDWMYRLSGRKPWEADYIRSLAEFLEGITREEIGEKRKAVPRHLPEFDKELQVNRVSHFIRDILAEV